MTCEFNKVPPCAHSLCLACSKSIIARRGSFKCPKCRMTCAAESIRIGSSLSSEDRSTIPLVGSWSSKVKHVVRSLLTSLGALGGSGTLALSSGSASSVPGAAEASQASSSSTRSLSSKPPKVLVFSQWDSMLDILEQALIANKVGCWFIYSVSVSLL